MWEMIDRFVQKRACAEKCLAEQGPCTCYPAKLKYYLYSTVSQRTTRLTKALPIRTAHECLRTVSFIPKFEIAFFILNFGVENG